MEQRFYLTTTSISLPGSVNLWESGNSWPDTENLEKLGAFKGWGLSELQTYLMKGDQPDSEPLEQILEAVRLLPLEASGSSSSGRSRNFGG